MENNKKTKKFEKNTKMWYNNIRCQLISRCKTRNPQVTTVERKTMVAVVYCGNYDKVKKRLDAIVAREAKNGYVPKGEYSFSRNGRIYMGTVRLTAA